MTSSARLKPPPLRQGDTIAAVAPSSNIKPEALERGCEALRRLGYQVVYDPEIFTQDLYFAGSVDRRLRELHQAFANPGVRAIVCARGGYGSNYLLHGLDVALVRRYPKIFAGYSDVTSLLTHLTDAAGLITFHGPMVIKDFGTVGGVHLPSWNKALSGRGEWSLDSEHNGFQALAAGQGEGELYGGCLSMLVASLGTPYEARTEGKLLFLEDVNAKPYQVDRMLVQLKLAGKLEGVRGIIFGEMLECVQAPDQGYTLQEIIMRVVGGLGVPIACGLRSGHVTRENVTLPFGVRARLTVDRSLAQLTILESATAES
jgi:muramoyltetrapeptide carboxypeptidase